MKKFFIFLILLGLVAGGVYYYDPGLLGLDAPAKSAKKVKKGKKARKKKKAEKPAAEAASADAAATPAAKDEPGEEEEMAPAEPAPKPLSFLDNTEARAKAKATGMPSLIIWYGSDWLPSAGKVVSEWTKLEKKGLPVVFGQIDERLGAVPNLHDRDKLLPCGAFFNLPVAVLLASDDTLLGVYSGKTVLSAAAMEKAVKRTLERAPKYMKLVEKALTVDGVEGAKAAADALDMMPYADAVRNKTLKEVLNRKDPEHVTMARYLYCMDHMGMFDAINAVLNGGRGADAKYKGNDRKFDDGIAFVQKVLKSRKLKDDHLQQWNSGLAYVYREKYNATKEPALRKKLVQIYRQVVKIDPESEYGKGAQRWADYWDEEFPYVFEEPYYDSGEMTVGFEKEWRVNVSSKVKGPGSYSFTLVPCKMGRMSSKGFQLYANGKHVCDANEPADKDTKTVTFDVPRALKGRVEVRFKVQCFDGWFGCAGEMIMKKL